MSTHAGNGRLLGPRYGAATVSIVGLVTIIAFEALAVSTAMPEVTRVLDAGSMYGLAFSLLFTGQLFGIVAAGTWAQRSGPMPPVFCGELLFATGSALAGLAGSFPILLVGRLIAGLGAGLAMVSLYVIVGAAYPLALRPKVFGWISAAWVLPSVIGPVVAAWLTDVVSWRAVFLVIVPLAAAAALGLRRAATLLRESPGPEYAPLEGLAQTRSPRVATRSTRTVLLLGGALTVSASAFEIGASRPGWTTAVEVALAAMGLVGLAVCVPRVLPVGALRLRRGQPCVTVARLMLMAAFSGTISFVPLLLHGPLGLDLLPTGALLAVASVGWAGGSLVQSRQRLADHGPELVVFGTIVLATAGLGLTAVDALSAPVASMAFVLALLGLGMGLAVTSTSVLALALSPPGGHAEASSSLQVADVLGSVLGVASAGAVFAAGTRLGWAQETIFPTIWLTMCAIAALGIPAARRIRV
ncbi:MAG: MFS transporter [Dermatophilaceae bacterium]